MLIRISVLALMVSFITNLSVFPDAGAFIKARENGLADLEWGRSGQNDPWLTNYLSFYGFPRAEKILAGLSGSERQKLFVLVMEPARTRGTVILLHGYMDHSGNMTHPARALLNSSYRVVLFDLPGHGLSDGKRGGISDFSLYGRALLDVQAMVRDRFGGPLHFVGHSTACAACYEALREYPRSFDRIVFAAPLVRPSWWWAIRAGYFLYPFLSEVPRSFADYSGDEEYGEYLRFLSEKDPLQEKSIPREWVGALIIWNDRLKDGSVPAEEVLIIQGDNDSALDWNWNLEFLREKLPGCRVEMVPGGKHVLFNESEQRRQAVLERMIRHLDDENR